MFYKNIGNEAFIHKSSKSYLKEKSKCWSISIINGRLGQILLNKTGLSWLASCTTSPPARLYILYILWYFQKEQRFWGQKFLWRIYSLASGTSARTIVHTAQLILNGKFQVAFGKSPRCLHLRNQERNCLYFFCDPGVWLGQCRCGAIPGRLIQSDCSTCSLPCTGDFHLPINLKV